MFFLSLPVIFNMHFIALAFRKDFFKASARVIAAGLMSLFFVVLWFQILISRRPVEHILIDLPDRSWFKTKPSVLFFLHVLLKAIVFWYPFLLLLTKTFKDAYLCERVRKIMNPLSFWHEKLQILNFYLLILIELLLFFICCHEFNECKT